MRRASIWILLVSALDACGGSASAPLLDRVQGRWELTGLDCNGTDLSGFISTSNRMVLTISGTAYALARTVDGCTVTDQGTHSPDEAGSRVTITPSGPPACTPAGCDSSCGSITSPVVTVNVTVSGNSLSITSSGTDFPNNICINAPGVDPPARITFTRG
jgi:hypothetical protein